MPFDSVNRSMPCRNIPVFSTQCLSYRWYSKLFLLTISPLSFLPVSSYWAFFWFTLSTFFHICVFFLFIPLWFFPPSPYTSVIYFMIYHLLRIACTAHNPFLRLPISFPSTFFATSPTLVPPSPWPRPHQHGRAQTWCTTTCLPTWTSPAWTRRAAAAACLGQSWAPICRRTPTTTPSGPATVTGWDRCRERVASPIRTRECTAPPGCTIM